MKDYFINQLKSCCDFKSEKLQEWVNTLKFTDEVQRSNVLNSINDNGYMSLEGWLLLFDNVNMGNVTTKKITAWYYFTNGELGCSQWARLIENAEYDNINFIVEADWGANGVTDEASFRTSLETPYSWSYGRYQILELPDENEAQATFTIKDFVLEGDKISCEIQGDGNMLDLMDYNVLEIIRLNFNGLQQLGLGNNQLTNFNPDGNFSGLQQLYLNNNQLTNFNPDGNFSGLQQLGLGNNQLTNFNPDGNFSGLQQLYLNNNQLTNFNPDGNFSGLQQLGLGNNQITNWTNTAWISSLPNNGTAYFQNNPTSSNGTPVKTALIAKGWTVQS